MRFKKSVSFLFALYCSACLSQDIEIGQWRSELSYNKGLDVADAEDKVYAIANGNLFSYSKSDNSIERLSKVNGWSDIGVSAIHYSKDRKVLVVAYANSNLDLLEKDVIVNISDIKSKQILGDKSVNNIFFDGDFAYLACGFGIIKLNIVKKEIADTYYIGTNGAAVNVRDVLTDGNYVFAATDDGIYRASKNNTFLSDFNQWTRFFNDSTFNTMALFNGNIVVNKYSSIYNNDKIYTFDPATPILIPLVLQNYTRNTCHNIRAFNSKLVVTFDDFIDVYDASFASVVHIYDYFQADLPGFAPLKCVLDTEGKEWIADRKSALMKGDGPFLFERFAPEGPNTNSVTAISVENGNLWVAPGSKDAAWGNLFNIDGVSGFYNGSWTNVTNKTSVAIDTLFDIITVLADPNDPKRCFAGSWSNGLIEIKEGKVSAVYNEKNSTLRQRPEFRWIGVGGLDFDKGGTVWFTNSYTKNALQALDINGNFTAFDCGSELNNTLVGNVVATSSGPKWMVLPNGNGVLVYDDNSSLDDPSDDKIKKLNFTAGSGGIVGSDVSAMAEDADGQMWIGTDKGISVFYSPTAVFGTGSFDAQQIKLEQDGYVQNLLETELVTAIAVDGANRKWIGTQNSGVYFMSADGTQQLAHYTAANSPLFSDEIRSIAINGKNGQVYFATANGIVSYKSAATDGADKFVKEEVFAYPNPVRPDYTGTIAIKGLTKNADVKITDISGTLIFQTKALGGQAIWNGRDTKGIKAQSGVYTIFCASEDGSKTIISKLLFLN